MLTIIFVEHQNTNSLINVHIINNVNDMLVSDKHAE